MYTRWNNAEGQANTTVASVANSGGSATGGSGWALDADFNAWPTFSTDTAASGTQSYKYVYSASHASIQWNYFKPGITGDNIWVRFAFNTSDITQNPGVFNAAGNTQTIFGFQLSSSKARRTLTTRTLRVLYAIIKHLVYRRAALLPKLDGRIY